MVPLWLVDILFGRVVFERWGYVMVSLPWCISGYCDLGSSSILWKWAKSNVDELRGSGNVRGLLIHTEHRYPCWFSERFVKEYVHGVRVFLEEISGFTEVERVVVEVHPGFSDYRYGRDLGVVLNGMARFMAEAFEVLRGMGVDVFFTVENRCSTIKVSSSGSVRHYPLPQTIATLQELEEALHRLKAIVSSYSIDDRIGVTIDPYQTFASLRYLTGRDLEDLFKEYKDSFIDTTRRLSGNVLSIHVHWYKRGRRQISAHKALDDVSVKEFFEEVIRIVAFNKPSDKAIYVVPELYGESNAQVNNTIKWLYDLISSYLQ